MARTKNYRYQRLIKDKEDENYVLTNMKAGEVLFVLMVRNYNLSNKFLYDNFLKNPSDISENSLESIFMYQNISEKFIFEKLDLTNFKMLFSILRVFKFSRKGVRKIIKYFRSELEWMELCNKHNNLSEKFMDENSDNLEWYFVSSYQKFSEKFFWKHVNKLNLELCLYNRKLSWIKRDNRSKKLELFMKLKGDL
jgi:hypothetical protein